MGNLGSAYVEIAANLSKLDSGLKTAKSDVNKFLKGISRDLDALNFMPIIKNIAQIGWQFAQITAPITVAAGALFAIQKHTADVGEELFVMSQKTGISVEMLYSLRKALEMDDLTLGDLSVAFKTLSKNLVDAKTGTGDMANVFRTLGIDTTKPLIDIFTDLAKVFSEFQNGEDKIALATMLFGKSGAALIPVLNDLGEKGLKVSKVFGEDSAQAADIFNDNLTLLKQTIEDISFSIGNKLIPVANRYFSTAKAVLSGESTTKEWQQVIDMISKAKNEMAGITKMKDLPFMYNGVPFQPKNEIPESVFVDSKEAKKEADKAAKEIADAYKDMYNSLKYESDGYIEYKTREYREDYNRNVKLTGDISLAWAVLYSNLKSLDEGRGAAEKKRTDEERQQARLITETYKEMYDSLGFDTAKYYEYRKGLLAKRRDEEIAITGDMALAWEVYYARLKELDEKRMERSNSLADGFKLFVSDIERNGAAVASSTKEMFQDMYSGTGNALNEFLTNVRTGNQTIGQSFAQLGLSIQASMMQAIQDMIVKMIMAKAITALFGASVDQNAVATTNLTGASAGLVGVMGAEIGMVQTLTVAYYALAAAKMAAGASGGGGGGELAGAGGAGGDIGGGAAFHEGGLAGDEMYAKLKKHEFVINPSAVKHWGTKRLEYINSFHDGGLVTGGAGSIASRRGNMDGGAGGGSGSGERVSGRGTQSAAPVTNITIQAVDAESFMSLANKHRDVLVGVIANASRQNNPMARRR